MRAYRKVAAAATAVGRVVGLVEVHAAREEFWKELFDKTGNKSLSNKVNDIAKMDTEQSQKIFARASVDKGCVFTGKSSGTPIIFSFSTIVSAADIVSINQQIDKLLGESKEDTSAKKLGKDIAKKTILAIKTTEMAGCLCPAPRDLFTLTDVLLGTQNKAAETIPKTGEQATGAVVAQEMAREEGGSKKACVSTAIIEAGKKVPNRNLRQVRAVIDDGVAASR